MKNVTCSALMAVVSSSSLLAQPTLVATPSSGELGSIVQLSVVPQTPGFELTAETIGVWTGQYKSIAGDSQIFATTYEGETFSIIDDWTAEILLGLGTHAPKNGSIEFSDFSSLAPNGTLEGGFQFITPNPCQADLDGSGDVNFSDISVFLIAYSNQDPVADFSGDGLFNFSDVSAFLISYGQGCGPISILTEGAILMGFTVEPAKWFHIAYPDGWASGGVPELLFEDTDDLGVFPAASLPSIPDGDFILSMSGAIYSIVLDVESNASTSTGNPASIFVDVFTIDNAQVELDRVSGLELQFTGVVDNRVRYSSHELVNIMLTDVFLDDATFTTLRTIQCADYGDAYIVLHIGD